ncbi:MAG TPA: alpha/beta hydrolase-fold protein, partial [Limnochordia bacterium]
MVVAMLLPVVAHAELQAVPAAAGRVVADSFWSQALGIRKHYVVWLPPSYARQPERRYPVVYYLHGAFGRETDWVQYGHLDRTLDSLVAAGMPEMIVVMPDGDDGWYTTWNFLGNNATCRSTRPPDAEPAHTYCDRPGPRGAHRSDVSDHPRSPASGDRRLEHGR